jgi:hypothetical protein
MEQSGRATTVNAARVPLLSAEYKLHGLHAGQKLNHVSYTVGTKCGFV